MKGGLTQALLAACRASWLGVGRSFDLQHLLKQSAYRFRSVRQVRLAPAPLVNRLHYLRRNTHLKLFALGFRRWCLAGHPNNPLPSCILNQGVLHVLL